MVFGHAEVREKEEILERGCANYGVTRIRAESGTEIKEEERDTSDDSGPVLH